MSTIKEVLEMPVKSYRGQGQIFLENGLSLTVKFEIMILRNGKTIGKLFFITFDNKVYEQQKNIKNFRLIGTSENNEEITAERCILTSLKKNHHINYPNKKDDNLQITTRDITITKFSAIFSCYQFLVNPKILEIYNNSDLIIKFDLINVRHFSENIVLESILGQLNLKNYPDIKDIEDVMKLNKLPLITSKLEIEIIKNNLKKLEIIKKEVIDLIQNLLKITSLSQITWHDWVFLEVYEKESNKMIYLEFSTPKIKSTRSTSIIPINKERKFITSLFNEYSTDLNKYGFDVALELLVESIQNEILQLNFLAATTCLETIMYHFHKINQTEYVLNDEEFDTIYGELKNKSKEILKNMDKTADIRKSIYESLQEIKRRHYTDKAKKLLEGRKISYEDIPIKIDEIVKTRNNIVHAGGDNMKDQESLGYLMRVWKGLMSILIRLFLSMLNYKGNYQDWFLDREVSLQ